jgi:hypothetical protein
MSFLDLAAASHVNLSQQAALKIGQLFFTSSVLPFNMQAQTQTNWCWAATSTSVSHFYFSSSSWTQCKVASAELSRTDCCNSPVPSPCNVSWYLDRALTRTSNFASMVSGTISFAAIEAELNAGRVIGTRIGWSGGGGHFMCVYGCSRVGSTEFVDIDDPIYGKSHITLATFTNSYQGNGRWTHTYYTKRWPTLKIKLPELSARVAELIGEMRPLLAIKQGVREFAVQPPVALAVPHHVYVMGLNDILEREDPTPAKPSSLRVFEVQDGKNHAVFDVTTSDQGAPQLHSMSEDAATLDILQRGLSEAQRVAEQADVEPELQFVRVPALYIEAYWLRYPDKTRDVVIPVRALGLFPPNQPVPAGEFIAKLREQARERMRGSKDETIAP